jgi:short-subunit dehydrogenase
MSKVLREETKKTGVKVTAVLPGAVLTDSWAGVDLPIERFIQPHDVADAIWSCYSLGPGAVVEELLIRPQLGDI